MPPTLDELRSRQVITGVPSSDDLIPYIDVDEVGNAVVKKSLVSSIGASAASVQTALAADPAGAREAMEAQSSAIGFLERFDRNDRYAEGASITANTSLPEIGTGYAYRVRVDGGTGATVVSGALRPNANTLYYLQNRVATPNGKFSMGFVFELERSSVYLTAVNNGGGNFSICDQSMISDGGDIGGLDTKAPIHINWSNEGITAATLYPSTALTCLNRALSGGIHRWDAGGKCLPLGEKFAILVRVIGDILEIEAVGIGTVVYTHPDISARIGTEYTYFWAEPNGESVGSDYRHVARLYRWWAMAEELNQTPGYGFVFGTPSNFLRVPSRLELFNEGSTTPLSANTPAGTNIKARISAWTTTAKGIYNRFTGGLIHSEGMISHDYGFSNAGAQFQGFMVGAFDSNLNTEVSSAAGAATFPNVGSDLWLMGLENADWQTVFYAGQLIGVGNKRIRVVIDSAPFAGANLRVLADSNTTGTPLNGTTGFWTCEIRRYTNSGSGMVFYTELKANGVVIHATRQTLSLRDALVYGGPETTTADAGGVTIDTHIRTVGRVNPL